MKETLSKHNLHKIKTPSVWQQVGVFVVCAYQGGTSMPLSIAGAIEVLLNTSKEKYYIQVM